MFRPQGSGLITTDPANEICQWRLSVLYNGNNHALKRIAALNALLDHFTLVRTRWIRLHAELLKPVAAEQPHQLKVEIKLTPSTLPKDNPGMPEYQLGCRMHCLGHLPQKENDPLFQTEVLMNAIYRQVQGSPLDFSQFSTLHSQCNRQLYPLLRLKLIQLVRDLGINQVQLPEDLFTQMEENHQGLDNEGPEKTTRLH